MTADGKLLKISCLAALFAGLASLAVGIFLAIGVGNMIDIDAWVTAAEGLASTVYGVRTAILANVPSNTSKIKTFALCLTVLGIAVVSFLLYSAGHVEIIQTCLAVVVCVIAVVGFVLASRIVKEQLRK